MDLIVAWLVFPALMLALCAGCGLLVELLAKRRLATPAGADRRLRRDRRRRVSSSPWPTRPPRFAAPVVVVDCRRRPRAGPQGARDAARVAARSSPPRRSSCVYAAPIVLSGRADDRRVHQARRHRHLALADRPDHGARPRAGGARPSTYEATLHFNLADGYPVGVFVPFGVGAELLGTDPAWLIQPYIAFAAALLALALWALAVPLERSPWLRGLAAFVGAQPASALRLLPLGRGQGGGRGRARRRVRRDRDPARWGAPRIAATVAGALLTAAALARRAQRGRARLAGAGRWPWSRSPRFAGSARCAAGGPGARAWRRCSRCSCCR